METNLVVKFFEGVAKFLYALLPTILPYSTPLPIAMITASSAETFFGMTPLVAGVFVFSLEGLGVWSTTTFIDKFVDWIRSRNSKVAWMSFIMALVVAAYLTILVLLNVVLKGDNSTAYKAAVTLVCFLPFIAGILNGFRKVELQDKDMRVLQHTEQLTKEERKRLDRKEARREKLLIQHGFDPREVAQAQAERPQAQPKEKHAGDYKDFVMELLDQTNGQVELTEITKQVNKVKRVQLVHGDVKSTWLKFKKEWTRAHSG